jgi:hypothetical protein
MHVYSCVAWQRTSYRSVFAWRGSHRKHSFPPIVAFIRVYTSSPLQNTARSKSHAHHNKQLYFAGLMHKLQDMGRAIAQAVSLRLPTAAV